MLIQLQSHYRHETNEVQPAFPHWMDLDTAAVRPRRLDYAQEPSDVAQRLECAASPRWRSAGQENASDLRNSASDFLQQSKRAVLAAPFLNVIPFELVLLDGHHTAHIVSVPASRPAKLCHDDILR